MTHRRGRTVDHRLRVRGWLKLQTPLHVGGAARDPAEALPVAVDGQGRVYVPGTGLAGALRSWTLGIPGDQDPLGELWGIIREPGDRSDQDQANDRSGENDNGGSVERNENGEGGTGGEQGSVAPDDDLAEGNASRVVVRDAVIATSLRTDADGLPADPLAPEALPVRHGVGIDRVTGAAAAEFLYARTVVPAGNYLRLELDLETTEENRARDRARLHTLLSALLSEQVRLGAAKGRGLGVVCLLRSPLTVHEHDFTGPTGLLDLLLGEPARLELDELAGADDELPARRELLTVRGGWRPVAPVMVRAGEESACVGTVPLTTRMSGDTVALTLSGGSIKGALRSHAEFIERTARGLNDTPRAPVNAPAHEHSTAFRDQLDQLGAVKALFGAARTAPDPDGEHAWGAGALLAEECVSSTRVPADLWDLVIEGSQPAAEQAESAGEEGEEGDASARKDHGEAAPVAEDDAATPEAKRDAATRARKERWTPRSDEGGRRPLPLDPAVRDRLTELGLDQADHVAIDRWTGGAADGLLFSVLEPHDVEWEPIRLTVDLTRLGSRQDLALALLLLVLRDLRDGQILLGGMVTRGFGDVKVGSVLLTGGPWGSDGVLLDDVLRASDQTLDRLERAWSAHLEAAR